MLRQLPLAAAVAALALALAVPVALASRSATRSETRAITRAVETSPVADVDRIPTNRYRVGGIKVTTLPSRRLGAWAIASIIPVGRFKNTMQGADVILVKPAGTNDWTAVDVGTAEVGCGIAPDAVLKDLYHSSGDVCPPGQGV
jgi:hypothetical protein